MKIYRIDSPIGEPLPSKDNQFQKTIPTSEAPTNRLAKDKDPLIAWGWEKVVYGLVFVLITLVLLVVGIINKKLEHVLFLALFLSGLILFMFL